MHEATARARLYAILTSLRLVDAQGAGEGGGDEQAMVGLIEAVRESVAEADKSTSK